MCISPDNGSGTGLGLSSVGGRGWIIGVRSSGGVGGDGGDGREGVERVGEGVGGLGEYIALAGAKWTCLIVAVGKFSR
jgi:hypothetical protein